MQLDTQQSTIQTQQPDEYPWSIFIHYRRWLFTLLHMDINGQEELVRSWFVDETLPGALWQHRWTPLLGTLDLKTTALRFTAAKMLSNSLCTHWLVVMSIEEAVRSDQLDSSQGVSVVRHLPNQSMRRGVLILAPAKRSFRTSFKGRKTECLYCRQFGWKARKCEHNQFWNHTMQNLCILSQLEAVFRESEPLYCLTQGLQYQLWRRNLYIS